ncbi:MAG: tyrosine-type recombinase/integrase [Armatimonadetes bacterium]|nr:tyrosine-type recombinase/integrase [Armatimonadota bacterium]
MKRPLTTQAIKRFLVGKSETASKSTAKRYHNVLSPFFKFLLSEGLLDSNPMATVALPRAPTAVIEPLSVDEVAALVQAKTEKDFVSLRNQAVLLILLDCGLRATELCDLTLEDVDFHRQVFVVRHGKGGKPRIVLFGSRTVGALRQYLLRRGDLKTPELIVNCYGERTDRTESRI